MSSSKAFSPGAEWRDAYLSALCEVVPCVMVDVHRLTVAYLTRQCVEWCPDLVNSDAENGFARWLARAPAAGSELPYIGSKWTRPQEATEIAARMDARGGGVVVQAGGCARLFQWMVARQTLRESGLRRWSFALGSDFMTQCQCMGLTLHTRAAIDRLDNARATGPAACSDQRTALLSTYGPVWCHSGEALVVDAEPTIPVRARGTVAVDRAATDEAKRRGVTLTPRLKYSPQWSTGRYEDPGVVYTFDADLTANTVRVQLRAPCSSGMGTSEVLVLTLPKSTPVGDCRPVALLWEPCTMVELPSDDEFPRFD